ncbi:hypothetical protein [Clostridium sp. SGI.024]|jgi:hypothetical protein|uniref:hypothetical protein n=1 Tax=Clostridium sp. SGI.024 TaxID=3420551 RepID=UPI0025CC2E5F|nr:hypothetical protein [uncultured Clostridium sp.]MCI6691983.1 hypothetical protein [Clostridium sp.]
MGKFKEMYINYLNLDKEKRECIKGYSKEYIYDVNNKRLLLSQYILMSKKYIYEIKATEGTAHLWTWSDFKDEAKGKILSYKTEGNIIISQLMEFNKEIDLEILNKYNLEIIQRLN